jgi:transcription termination/antitermination protein NusG
MPEESHEQQNTDDATQGASVTEQTPAGAEAEEAASDESLDQAAAAALGLGGGSSEAQAPAEVQAPAPADADQGDDEDEPMTRPGMRWCVLRVASNREETVRDALEKKVKIEGLEDAIGRILVPTEKRPAPRGRGKQKVVDRKMYPGYVFIEIKLEEDGTIDEKAWFTVKETSGVGDFIGAGGKPSPMAEADVAKMLEQINQSQEGGPVAVAFAKDDQVKIKEGAFENFEGAVDEVLPEKGLVRVVVTIFGRATPVELEYWQVEKI